MRKIKLIQTITTKRGYHDEMISYLDILEDVNRFKDEIYAKLVAENLQDKFEIIINVNNEQESYLLMP